MSLTIHPGFPGVYGIYGIYDIFALQWTYQSFTDYRYDPCHDSECLWRPLL